MASKCGELLRRPALYAGLIGLLAVVAVAAGLWGRQTATPAERLSRQAEVALSRQDFPGAVRLAEAALKTLGETKTGGQSTRALLVAGRAHAKLHDDDQSLGYFVQAPGRGGLVGHSGPARRRRAADADGPSVGGRAISAARAAVPTAGCRDPHAPRRIAANGGSVVGVAGACRRSDCATAALPATTCG